MADMDDWLHEVRRWITRDGKLPGLTINDAAASASVLRDQGFLGALPLWNAHWIDLVLLARPECDYRDWQVLLIKDGEALTTASNVATALPQFLVARLIAGNPEGRDRLRANWQQLRAKLVELNALLGGDRQSIEMIEQAVLDSSGGLDNEGEVGRLRAAIDTSAPFERFAAWLEHALMNGVRDVPSDDLGPWRRLALSWLARSADKVADEIPIEGYWHLLEQFAGIDTGVSTEPSWFPRPGAASSAATLLEVFDRLGDVKPTDAVRSGIRRALATEGADYDGLAHAEAVPLLAERGEAKRAWGVLHSAAWWSARSKGKTAAALHKAADLLCDQNDWPQVARVLKYNAGKSA